MRETSIQPNQKQQECCCEVHHRNYGRCLQCLQHGQLPEEVTEPLIRRGDKAIAERDAARANLEGQTRSHAATIREWEAAEERVRTLENLLRRYHERVTAANNVLGGIIASRSYLKEAMATLPHPTIGDEVSAALGEEAPHA